MKTGLYTVRYKKPDSIKGIENSIVQGISRYILERQNRFFLDLPERSLEDKILRADVREIKEDNGWASGYYLLSDCKDQDQAGDEAMVCVQKGVNNEIESQTVWFLKKGEKLRLEEIDYDWKDQYKYWKEIFLTYKESGEFEFSIENKSKFDR